MREAILTQSLEKYIQDTFIKTSLVSAKSTPNPMESLWSLLGFESIIQQPIEPVMNVPSVPGCALEASLLFGTICPITVTPPFSLIHIGSSGSFERDQISELSQVRWPNLFLRFSASHKLCAGCCVSIEYFFE